jgi:hypothetical protein
MAKNQKIRADGEDLTDLVNGRLRPEEALRLLDEVERDPALSSALDRKISLMDLTRSEDVRGVFAELDLKKGGVWAQLRVWGGEVVALVHIPRYAVIAGVLLLLLLGWWGMMQYVGRIPPSYAMHLEVKGEDFALRLRSFSDADISLAAERIVAGEYPAAVERLERFIRMHPDDEFTSLAEHVSGVIRIVGATRRPWGVGVWVDRHEVRLGLDRLASVRGRIGVKAVEEEGLWYEALGWLMLGDEVKAGEILGRVVKMSGVREKEARDLLEGLSHRNN